MDFFDVRKRGENIQEPNLFLFTFERVEYVVELVEYLFEVNQTIVELQLLLIMEEYAGGEESGRPQLCVYFVVLVEHQLEYALDELFVDPDESVQLGVQDDLVDAVDDDVEQVVLVVVDLLEELHGLLDDALDDFDVDELFHRGDHVVEYLQEGGEYQELLHSVLLIQDESLVVLEYF